MNTGVSLADVRAAAARIHGAVMRTPLLYSEMLSRQLGCELWLKCENLQYIGAFKARGACNAVFQLTDEEARSGVVTHSSGNHAAAVARAAVMRGIQAHIVMPHNSATVKLNAVRALGVTPILCEPNAAAREAMAADVMQRTGATMIHPYNDLRVIAGQGTVALEILEDLPEVDVIVAPVGGGGLLSGTLIASKGIKPSIHVDAAEPLLANDAARSLKSGKIEQNDRFDTIADGLRTPLGTLTFPIIRDLVREVVVVSEQAIVEATRTIFRTVRVVTEPSGAVSFAAIQQNPQRYRGQKVVAVISGGNLDLNILNDHATS